MMDYLRFVSVVAVLIAFVLCVPVQAQTPEFEALRARAEQGDAEAQFHLGFMYDNGNGVLQEYAEAVRWYRLAAEQGHAQAQNNLGVRYGTGQGIQQDDVLAHMWFNLAASRSTGADRENAVRARDLVTGRMTPDQIADAHRLAHEWDVAHPREPYIH